KLRRGRPQKAFYVRVTDAQNNTAFLRDPDEWVEFSPSLLRHPENTAENEKAWLRLHSRDGYFLEVASSRFPDGTILQVGKTSEDARDLLSRFRYFAILAVSFLIPIGFIGAAYLSMRLLRPVRQLSETVVGILKTGSFAARVPSRQTGDELDELIGLFNALLSRIGSLVRAMKDSLDNVAHDLRTPMTRLRNVAHATLEKDADLPTTREALVECVEESERVMTMLNTLMDIAEAENGLLRIKRTQVPVAAMLGDIVDLYQAVADEEGVTISMEASDITMVNGDAVLLRRAIANLIDNAIKYTPSGGKVAVCAFRQGENVMISVKDSGIGVSLDDLPRIWERLYRGDKSRSKRGLGLGLSFVRAIIHAHGGHVSAESTTGKGSTFRVQLPINAPETKESPSVASAPAVD
ncbi:MAG TPA: ATP-binding protein, partial [Chthoniobacteraceae bacterium]|nr:ATP-binding protein [Chthoniobacteraceae bacterium]